MSGLAYFFNFEVVIKFRLSVVSTPIAVQKADFLVTESDSIYFSRMSC